MPTLVINSQVVLIGFLDLSRRKCLQGNYILWDKIKLEVNCIFHHQKKKQDLHKTYQATINPSTKLEKVEPKGFFPVVI